LNMLRARRAPGAEGSFADGAAPVLLAAKLTNTRLVEPLDFGDALVGLSGLYAIINAIRLAVGHRRHLTESEVCMLMAVGFDFLSGRLTPRQAFQSGCRLSLWRAMAAAIIEAARQRLGFNLGVQRLIIEGSSRDEAFFVIQAAIERWQPVLMLSRGGRYTVVSGFTPASLLLFDSRACWLSKHACGVPGDGESARHLLIPNSLTALQA
jgi:hypothetical protein